MKTSTQSLPGVRSIGVVDCTKLQANVALAGICGMPVPVVTAILPVSFTDEPECSCETEKTGGKRVDTASLKFCSTELIRIDGPVGFVVTDIQGECYLIGGKEEPYPKITPTRQLGTPDGDPAVIKYEITHKALKSLIPCVASYE